ncbi:NAD-dependent epimerase/dehydratase family protein [Streptomyces cirratus]|uniref:NAD-dependent epimerase/dehydratase family protein n=1 Tax=Streptomyces cirratus TaxID=68187 RepID=UPI00360B7A6A
MGYDRTRAHPGPPVIHPQFPGERLSLIPERILVTGGTGFVGSHVTQRLRTTGPDAPVLRLLTHHRPTPGDGDGGAPAVETVTGDLTDPASLRGICDGVTTVVHLAARIGGTQEQCRAVNTEGTRALLAEAARAGVRRFVHLGTAAVYRDEPHRGAAEGVPAEEPSSPTSVTRLAGERLVLAAGGTVLRPHLVYGRGDTWVIPAVADLMGRLPHWVDGGRARISMISADALAGAVADLAGLPELPAGQVLHASHPEPVTCRELITAVARALDLPLPEGEVTLGEALELLGGADDPVVRRRLSLLTVDHWYDSGRLWKLVGAGPGPRLGEAFERYASWYRDQRAASTGTAAVATGAGATVTPVAKAAAGAGGRVSGPAAAADTVPVTSASKTFTSP